MVIEFNKPPSVFWDEEVKVSYIQRRIIVASILYYKKNYSIVEDYEYDELSQQLVKWQKSMNHKVFRKTRYYYCMKDFDGSTGFDLPDRLNKTDKDYLGYVADKLVQHKVFGVNGFESLGYKFIMEDYKKLSRKVLEKESK